MHDLTQRASAHTCPYLLEKIQCYYLNTANDYLQTKLLLLIHVFFVSKLSITCAQRIELARRISQRLKKTTHVIANSELFVGFNWLPHASGAARLGWLLVQCFVAKALLDCLSYSKIVYKEEGGHDNHGHDLGQK